MSRILLQLLLLLTPALAMAQGGKVSTFYVHVTDTTAGYSATSNDLKTLIATPVNTVFAGHETYFTGGKQADSSYTIIKHNGNGAPVWIKRYSTSGINDFLPLGMIVTSRGEVVLLISCNGPNGRALAYIKINTSGAVVQSRVLTVSSIVLPSADAIVADNAGGFIMGGSWGGSNPIIAVDASGNVSWAKSFPGGDVMNISGITTSDGNTFAVYATGPESRPGVPFGKVGIFKVDKSGAVVGKSNVYDFSDPANVVSRGNIATAPPQYSRYYWSTLHQSAGNEIYLAATNSETGAVIWSKKIALSGNTSLYGFPKPLLTPTPDGGVILLTDFSRINDTTDRVKPLLIKFDKDGNKLYSRKVGVLSKVYEFASGMLYNDKDGTILLTGIRAPSFFLERFKESDSNSFCARMSYPCTVTDMPLVFTQATLSPMALCCSPAFQNFNVTVSSRPMLPNYYCRDTVSSIIDNLAAGNWKMPEEGAYVYPNPAKSQLTVGGPESSKVEVFSLVGQLMLSASLAANKQSIDITALPPGQYLVRVISKTGSGAFLHFLKQ